MKNLVAIIFSTLFVTASLQVATAQTKPANQREAQQLYQAVLDSRKKLMS